MSSGLHKGHGIVVISVLEADLVGHQLIMQARLGQRLGSREALIDGVDDALHGSSDDAAASCGSGNQK